MRIPLIVAVPAVILGPVGVVTLPAPALLMWLALGVVAGGVTWAWARFSRTPAPISAPRVAALTTAAGLALAGSMAVLGAATLAVLVALTSWALWATLSEQARCAR